MNTEETAELIAQLDEIRINTRYLDRYHDELVETLEDLAVSVDRLVSFLDKEGNKDE